jgi:hypothetical protein
MRAAIGMSVGGILAVALVASGQGSREHRTSPADALSFVAGCWEQRSATRVVEEHWMPPAGGALLGVSRTLRKGAAGETMAEFEFLRIVSRDGGWVYIAQPSGRAPTEFVAGSAGDGEVTFVNEAHDFPQRITYRAIGRDSLFARVEGPSGGGVRGIDYRYARVGCGGER